MSKIQAIKVVVKKLDFGVSGAICVILGKSVNCSETQFSHPSNGTGISLGAF